MPNRTISLLSENSVAGKRLLAASFHRHLLIDAIRERHLSVDAQRLDRTGHAKISDVCTATIEEVEVIYATEAEREIMAEAFANAREQARDCAQEGNSATRESKAYAEPVGPPDPAQFVTARGGDCDDSARGGDGIRVERQGHGQAPPMALRPE